MKIEYKSLKQIYPYPDNPRKNQKAIQTVANSIEQYGFQQPIVVDKDHVIVVGHTRYAAAKSLGIEQVPVIVASNLTEEQTRAYRIMDNRSNENAHWDDDLLHTELESLLADSNIQDVAYDTGFTESELDRLFRDREDPVSLTGSNEDARSQTGDIWVLGEHRLLNGDSTDAAAIEQLLAGETIDLLWEDPPYGVAYETANGINYTREENEVRNHKIANDNLTPEQLDAFLNAHLVAVTPYLRRGGSVYWAHDIRFNHQFKSLLEANGYHIADTLIWKKNRHSTFLSDYAKFYEPIIYGWKKGAEHRWYGQGMQPNTIDFNELEEMTREQLIDLIQSAAANYQEFNREPRAVASLHPTVKPRKLIQYHIINSSQKGDIVFDGFAGSGSTLIACENTQRQARCVEFEPKFVDTIIRRWQDQTGLEAHRASDGVKWNDINSIAGDPAIQEAFLEGGSSIDLDELLNG